MGEHGVAPEAAAILDASLAARRSPGLATALGNRWPTCYAEATAGEERVYRQCGPLRQKVPLSNALEET